MSLRIYGRLVEPNAPLFVIAELGLNHGGDPQRALQLVDAAALAGASAVKVQSFHAERLVAPRCSAPTHVEAASLASFFRQFELNEHAHVRIAKRAHRHGLAMIATPFDEDTVAVLERVECDAYKIASGDITHHSLIARAAATGKPLLISTGMSTIDEARSAVECARGAGAREIVVLHCVSAYPVPAGQENIRAVAELAVALGVPVGLSDHSTEPLSVPLAVALGASVYERHLALDTTDEQLERELSSTPSELRSLIMTAERTRTVLGDGAKRCAGAEHSNRTASRRSLHAARDLAAGERLEATSMVALRPAEGLDPRCLDELIGRRLARPVRRGQALREVDLAVESGEELRDVA